MVALFQFPKILLLTLGAAVSLSWFAASARAEVVVEEGAPPGFEALEKERNLMAIVSHMGEDLGVHPVELTPDTIRFIDPRRVLSSLDMLHNRNEIFVILSNTMPTNSDLICRKHEKWKCTEPKPEKIIAVWDESCLCAELHIHPDYLGIERSAGERYLPLPKREAAAVYQFDGAVSGVDANKPAYNLTMSNVYSYGEFRLNGRSSLSNNGLRFDTVSAEMERNGWLGQLGLMRSRPMQLAGDRDIAGIAYSTSLRTRRDEHKFEGNDLIIYLPRKAFVTLYREGRVYSARSYEAGNQQIDTSELPQGAYPVTIQIQESDGTMREEQRFFAKSQYLPPLGDPYYYGEIGVLRKPPGQDSSVPQLTDMPILRTGTTWRLGENTGVTANILGINDRVALESGAIWLFHGLEVRANNLISTRGDWGAQAGMLYIDNRWSVSADFRKLHVNKKTEIDYQGLVEEIEQAATAVSYAAHEDITLGGRINYSAGKGRSSSFSAGPYINWSLWRKGESHLFFSADIAHSRGQNEALALLRFSYRIGKHGITTEAGMNYGGQNAGAFGSANIWYDDTTSESSLLVSGGVQGDKNTKSAAANADYRNSYGRVRGSIQQSHGAFGAVTSYGGSFNVGATGHISEGVHVGGADNHSSAVVIEAAGDPTLDSVMRIYVDNAERGSVRIGEKQVVYLPPYHSYKIRLSARDEALLHGNEGVQNVTLYPGNVRHLKWNIARFRVVAGRVISPGGDALTNALLKESSTAITTSRNGRFQAELSNPSQLTFILEDGNQCEVNPLPQIQPRNGVLFYQSPLLCQPIAPVSAAIQSAAYE